MEYGLRDHRNEGLLVERPCVLILVLMEYGLRELRVRFGGYSLLSLNPCFNGIWSARVSCTSITRIDSDVLILVLMEYGLRAD